MGPDRIEYYWVYYFQDSYSLTSSVYSNTEPVLYDEETVTDVLFIGVPNQKEWDKKLLKIIYVIIPNFKVLMIRNQSNATVQDAKDLLLFKYKLAYVNPKICHKGQELEEESLDRYKKAFDRIK